MKIHVQIVQGPSANQSFYVEKDSRFTVGRGESANFQIEDDELLSREHFAMDFDGAQLTLTDLGSTNGTFVNGHPLTHRPVILKDNQQFVAGRVSRFVVQFVGQLEKKADAKTTPSIAAAPLPPEKHPTPQAPLPGSNPNTNFGTSIYSNDEVAPVSQAPPAPTPSSSEGGNFSQSIVTGFSDSAGPEQGSLLYSNPPSPAPSLAKKPKKTGPPATLPERGELPPLPPLPAGLSDDDFSSIAAPGGEGFPDTFAPLGGSEPNVPLTQVDPPDDDELPPLPGFDPSSQAPASPTAPSPESSPFASIHQPAAPQPVPAPPPIPAPQRAEPAETPQLRQEVPTDQMPVDTQSPFNAAGSIYTPGQMPQAPPENSPPPTQASIGHVGSSIGMPNQIPVAPQRREVAKPVKADLPPGKIGFQVRQFENGLFSHSGADAADVERIKDVLVSKFEAVFCAHLSRTEIDFSAGNEPAETPQMVEPDLGASPFEDVGDEEGDDAEAAAGGDSPFEDENEELKEKEAPKPEPQPPSIPKVGIPLFSWFPKESQWENPILLTNEEFSYSMEELWQQDALVSMFGSSAKQMTDHCLDLVQTNIRNGKKGAMFGFCWPSVLEGTLESQGEKPIARIFAGGIAAFLLEDPQEEFGWNIVSRNDMTQSLIDSGLVLLPT